MRRVSSFATTPFYLVATPIGNLSEFSPRAIEVLNNVDFICVEDSRTSGLLLHHFNIKKPLISVHKFNEVSKLNLVLQKIQKGEKGALLSDAGYPLISDPGSPLIKALIENNISVSVVNGPSALIPAILGSGFDTSSFTFIGFLRGKTKEITTLLSNYKATKDTLIIYESPHHYTETIPLLLSVLGERKLVIARELSKLHEEYIYTSLSEFTTSPLLDLKGELVLVIEGKINEVQNDLSASLEKVALLINKKGYSAKEAISIVATLDNISKNALSDLFYKQ